MSANTIQVSNPVILKEALRKFQNNLSFLGKVDRQYDDKNKAYGLPTGGPITVRKATRFSTTTGATLSLQDVTEKVVTIPSPTNRQGSFAVTAYEMACSLDEMNERWLNNLTAQMAVDTEIDVLNGIKSQVYNEVGTYGTRPTSTALASEARAMLANNAVPKGDRLNLFLNPLMMYSMTGGVLSYQNPTSGISTAFEDGLLSRAGGLDWYENQDLPTITTGTQDNTTPVTNGAGQTGSTLVVSGFDASATVKAGQTFTIAGVNAVQPSSGADLGYLQTFVVTADTTADGAGAITIPIAPEIIATGPYKTVASAPGNAKALTFTGSASTTYEIGYAMHPKAVTLATTDYPIMSAPVCERASANGISMLMTKTYDKDNHRDVIRFDVLYSYKVLEPRWILRVIGDNLA